MVVRETCAFSKGCFDVAPQSSARPPSHLLPIIRTGFSQRSRPSRSRSIFGDCFGRAFEPRLLSAFAGGIGKMALCALCFAPCASALPSPTTSNGHALVRYPALSVAWHQNDEFLSKKPFCQPYDLAVDVFCFDNSK